MRIAILTFHRAYNCGAMLQAWALKTILERMGHSVEFPACNHVGETKRWLAKVPAGRSGLGWLRGVAGKIVQDMMSIPGESLSRYRYKRFRYANLPERQCCPEEFSQFYDVVIFGSDQVWGRDCVKSDSDWRYFLGETISPGLKRISYAASCGDRPIMDVDKIRLKESLKSFSHVSARERLLVSEIQDLFRGNIAEVLDPTLLLSQDDYREITWRNAPKKEYLFAYTATSAGFTYGIAKYVARKLGLDLIFCPVYQYSRYGALPHMTYGCSPDRLVGYVANAKYVISCSFHGMVMALLHHKNFIDLSDQVEALETRSCATLRRLGIANHHANPSNKLDEIVDMIQVPVQDSSYDVLNRLRQDSIDWLKMALTR